MIGKITRTITRINEGVTIDHSNTGFLEKSPENRVSVLTILPTITLRKSYRRSDDHGFEFFYRRSDDHSDVFFAESYRRSDDHNSVFLPKVTDDPTIKFRFFCRKLPTIRRSHFGFFFERYRRSDDHFSVFFANISWLTSLTSFF